MPLKRREPFLVAHLTVHVTHVGGLFRCGRMWILSLHITPALQE